MSEQLPLPLAAAAQGAPTASTGPRLPDGDAHTPPGEPPDQAERQRIATDLHSTLFVEAGAGSGKTTALVDRVLALVRAGITLEHVAAITFTEKAAAELRQRLRERLEHALAADHDERYVLALQQLDGAAISTLHAFAQRVLFEHPIEAGLPPGVEVLDELASQVYFDERWDDFLPELLGDPAMAAPLLVADVLDIGPETLRALAQQFEANWDLVAARLADDPTPFDVDVAPAVQAMRELASAAGEALDATDNLAILLETVGQYADAIAAAAEGSRDPIDRIVDLAELLSADDPQFATRDGNPFKSKGAKGNWPDTERFDQLKLQLFEAGRVRDAALQDLRHKVITRLAKRIGEFVLEGVHDRRKEGRLRFHDLLVLARDVLRQPTHGLRVRASLRERYQRLLIDEFQDTDPIQVDLAALIATTADAQAGWDHAEPEPGRLFFVGDPKQSIYRFRRADISTYLRAQEFFGGHGGQVRLSANFRSTRPVIDWINRTFSQLIRPHEGTQPDYGPLVPTRGEPATGPGVAVLGADAHPGRPRALDLRTSEATDVAATIATAMAEGWSIADTDASGNACSRPVRLGDITVLLPARTSLPALEQALEAANIPYRAETQSLVYATPEVRDLLMVARCVDDPTDELATVMALRSPAFGCGDDDLYRYRQRPGATWNHQAVPDEWGNDDLVVAGLRWVAQLHQERAWLAPAQLLDRIVAERRLLELGVCQHRHREVWRRLRFVVDQARAWTDTTGGDLRDYLAWVRLQGSESARVAEAILPETDTDAIRIMTIHASKGLEFPVAIISGLTTQMQTRPGKVHVTWPADGTIGYRLGARNTTPEYDGFVPIDEQLDAHERLRLLYVACTRARDHLVVSLHRASEGSSATLASVLAGVDAAAGVVALEPRGEMPPIDPVELDRPPLATREAWAAERAHALGDARRSRTVAATAIARATAPGPQDPGLAKAPRDLDLPPWQKGRYGSAIGRAVHGVLQTIDLATGNQLGEIAAAQAAAEGVLGHEADVQALVSSALDSAIIREAAAATHWREIFVAAPVEGRLLEGYIDLLYDRGDGLVVVDHKTDAWDDDEGLDAKVARYRMQTAAYALAVELTTGRNVVDAALLFLAPEGAVVRHIPDLNAAKTDARALVPVVVQGGEATAAD